MTAEEFLKEIGQNYTLGIKLTTIHKLMEQYAQHVTAEKDKEIEQLDKSWARCNNLLGHAENELNKKHKELQQLKEENERLLKKAFDAGRNFQGDFERGGNGKHPDFKAWLENPK